MFDIIILILPGIGFICLGMLLGTLKEMTYKEIIIRMEHDWSKAYNYKATTDLSNRKPRGLQTIINHYREEIKKERKDGDKNT